MQPTKRDGGVCRPAPRASLAQPRFAADLQRWADYGDMIRAPLAFVFFSTTLLLAPAEALSQGACTAILPTPEALRRQIEERASRLVATDLFLDRSRWACVETRLAAADPVWLELWQVLLPEAPSRAARSARLAVARGLKEAPQLVLDHFGTGPCEAADVAVLGEKQGALLELLARRDAVARLVDSRYSKSRDECLGMIDDALGRLRELTRGDAAQQEVPPAEVREEETH
jgi:hypothetical protein